MKLLSFKVENYKSFNEGQGISFNFDEHNTNAIFGPNGSGKTNFFDALSFSKNFMLYSTQFFSLKSLYSPFALKLGNNQKPMRFTIEFSESKFIFLYTFAIDSEKVQDEALKICPSRSTNQKSFDTIFSRNSVRNGVYAQNGFTKELLKTTRSDSLMLTRAFETNNKFAVMLFKALQQLKIVNREDFIEQTMDKIADDLDYKQKVLNFLKASDLFIQNISVKRSAIKRRELINSDTELKSLRQLLSSESHQAYTTHFVRDDRGRVVSTEQFNLISQESTGTKRIFALAYPVLSALENGLVLYIDEFETALHTQECLFLVSLFNSKNNPKKAQLIINTHCSAIMDQIGYKNCFLFGKNQFEETIIGEIPGDSRNVALEKKYNRGDFGAVPRVEVIK